MHIFINHQSGMPIYEQISTRIQELILDGTLTEGEMLPSIRALAKDLRISVITTRRAYDELERAGLIYMVEGKGCFVAPRHPDLWREEHLKQIEEHMSAILHLSSLCGLTTDELVDMLRLMKEATDERH